MKYALALAAVAAVGVDAQAVCQKLADIKPLADPLTLFPPNTATFPCDMGSAVPLGKVPTGCSAYEVIVARGTSEPGDLGMVVGDPLVARVKRDLAGSRGYPVQYPASILGMDKGIADIKNRIDAQSKACPATKFALVGYSQGGMIVTTAAATMTAAQMQKVSAVVLYGAGEGKNLPAALAPKTLANCAPGDFACPNAGTGPGHVSYNNEGTVWHDRSAAYIVSAFQGKAVGQKLARVPTGPL